MSIFRRRKNHFLQEVAEVEGGIQNDKTGASLGDVVYNEAFPLDSEFASDATGELELEQLQSEEISDFRLLSHKSKSRGEAEFAEDAGDGLGAGVTENAPYHNLAEYKMVQPKDDESTISTHSS